MPRRRASITRFTRALLTEFGSEIHSIVLLNRDGRRRSWSEAQLLVITDASATVRGRMHRMGVLASQEDDFASELVFYTPRQLQDEVHQRSPLAESISSHGALLHDDGTVRAIYGDGPGETTHV